MAISPGKQEFDDGQEMSSFLMPVLLHSGGFYCFLSVVVSRGFSSQLSVWFP